MGLILLKKPRRQRILKKLRHSASVICAPSQNTVIAVFKQVLKIKYLDVSDVRCVTEMSSLAWSRYNVFSMKIMLTSRADNVLLKSSCRS